MTQAEFHNALRILTSIDKHELETAGVNSLRKPSTWEQFRQDPFRWFIRAEDADAARVWAIIEGRQRP